MNGAQWPPRHWLGGAFPTFRTTRTGAPRGRVSLQLQRRAERLRVKVKAAEEPLISDELYCGHVPKSTEDITQH